MKASDRETEVALVTARLAKRHGGRAQPIEHVHQGLEVSTITAHAPEPTHVPCRRTFDAATHHASIFAPPLTRRRFTLP